MNMRGKLELSWSCLLLMSWLFVTGAIASTILQDLEVDEYLSKVDEYLSKVNKPFVKSIQSPDGDIIDCIHITHQPAFDDPLFKNHTIKMKPDHHPTSNKMSKNESRTPFKTQMWQINGSCPKGTVPIRRTKREDVLKANFVGAYGKKKQNKIIPGLIYTRDETSVSRGHEYAVGYVEGRKYYGAKAFLNVWNPRVNPGEFSLGQIWLAGGSIAAGDVNSIEVGWHVNPNLYGDSNTRLFVYWTRDYYRNTGCHNLLCSGFVQTSNKIAVGVTLNPSSYRGSTQYEMGVIVWKDPKNSVWWLKIKDEVIGYWPTSLFTKLSDSAEMVEWGGEVYSQSNGQHTTTEMGSGSFPEGGFKQSAYIRDMEILDASNFFSATRTQDMIFVVSKPTCYNIRFGVGGTWLNYMYFGGPGRNPQCP